MPEMLPIASSTIAAAGYDEPSQTLELAFTNGTVYQYYNVPLHLYEQFVQSPSKGQFFNTYIKDQYG